MPSKRKVRVSHWARPIAGAIIVGLLATSSEVAVAQPINPSDAEIQQAREAADNAESVLQTLVAQVTSSERRVSDLELQMGTLREDVNKAMVDLDNARQVADRARLAVEEARGRLERTRQDLASAQSEFDQLARTVMRQGRSSGSILEGAAGASEALNRLTALRREAERQRNTVDNLDETRTQVANEESSLRGKSSAAEQAEATADQRHTDAENAYSQASRQLQQEQSDYQQAQVERDAAKASLEAARNAVNELNGQRREYENEQARQAAENAAAKKAADEAAAKTREELQAREEKEASSDSSAASSNSSNSSGSANSTSGNATSTGSTGSSSGSAIGSSSSASSGSSSTSGTPAQTATPANPETGQMSSSTASQKVETVIARAMSQLGVPYAWGGGNANGPTKGIRDGGVADSYGDYNKVGFDCSGLVLYAYAAIGINLPHYTGYQYQHGTHHPVSQMKRGDLLFWGTNGSSHVAIYLGDGQMIEAPQSGSVVKISPVRYNGMTPNVVRLV